jgi:hypothetical protein
VNLEADAEPVASLKRERRPRDALSFFDRQSDDGQRRLLRLRRKWPCGRATNRVANARRFIAPS